MISTTFQWEISLSALLLTWHMCVGMLSSNPSALATRSLGPSLCPSPCFGMTHSSSSAQRLSSSSWWMKVYNYDNNMHCIKLDSVFKLTVVMTTYWALPPNINCRAFYICIQRSIRVTHVPSSNLYTYLILCQSYIAAIYRVLNVAVV